MPIFGISPFGRGVSSAIQRARVRSTEEDDTRGLASLRDRLRARANEEASAPATAPAASREELLALTQEGEAVAQTVTVETSARESSGPGSGVGTTREPDDRTSRAGDLRSIQNRSPVFQGRTAASRAGGSGSAFGGGVRGTTASVGRGRVATSLAANPAGRPTDLIADLGNDSVPPLDTRADAGIRLLASARTEQATPPEPVAPPEAVESPQQTFPSAEEISRANTTPEIQENLRSDTAAISEGLQADAAVQSAANARQLAQAADGAQESGRNEVVDEGREQVQDLRTEVRELERLQTEARREIQDLENDIRRAQGA